ncbi:MAG: hypothetical protein F6K50_48590, partial [Moorea sp. SIO3I7]|nr:hypothetical protein [Moorena sp. SIO3I7]
KANSKAELLEQPTLENIEDIGIYVENLPESVSVIIPLKVISSSLYPTWSSGNQDSTAIEPALQSSETLFVQNSPATTNQSLESDDEETEQLDNVCDGLGDIRILPRSGPLRQPLESDNEEVEQLDNVCDGLGDIQVILRPRPSRQPDIQLILESSVSTNTEFGFDTALLFVNSVRLLATPKLSPKTRLIASAKAGRVLVVRSFLPDYNFLNLNLAVRQQVARGTYVQLGYVHQRLKRFSLLVENSAQLLVDRDDQLATNLRLNSFYELRVGSRGDNNLFQNTLGARLRHDVTPKLETALDSRILVINQNFSGRSEVNVRPQVSALAIYRPNKNIAVTASVRYLINIDDNSVENNLVTGLKVRLNLF